MSARHFDTTAECAQKNEGLEVWAGADNKLFAILVISHFIYFLMSRQLVGNFGGSIKWPKKSGEPIKKM